MFCVFCRTRFDENKETICPTCGRSLYTKDASRGTSQPEEPVHTGQESSNEGLIDYVPGGFVEPEAPVKQTMCR